MASLRTRSKPFKPSKSAVFLVVGALLVFLRLHAEHSRSLISLEYPEQRRSLTTGLNLFARVRQAEDTLRQHPTAELRSVIASLLRAGPQLQGNDSTLLPVLEPLLGALQTARPSLPCNATLLQESAELDEKILIATNLHNNADLMPNYIVQLLRLLCHIPSGQAFVSVYESGSADSTGIFLELFRLFLQLLEIPHRIITDGSLRRQEGQDRIEFLAQVRNKALEPIWLKTAQSDISDQEDGFARIISGGAKRRIWPADRVVFLNDVFFCAQDVLQLLSHKGDLVCGMDFERPAIGQLPRTEQQELFTQALRQDYWAPAWLGDLMGEWALLLRRWRTDPRTMQRYTQTAPLQFYDVWVARDAQGGLLSKHAPYVLGDVTAAQRLAAGLPIPVACCWNGLAVLPAQPFRDGLRLRAHRESECAASECSLLCIDLLRMGRSRFLMDPSVRVAYTQPQALQVHNASFVPGLGAMVGPGIQRDQREVDWASVPVPQQVQCCGLRPGKDIFDVDLDCQMQDVMNLSSSVLA